MQKKQKRASLSYLLSLLWLLSLVFSSSHIYGSSYRHLKIEEVVKDSELIFEGRVVDKEYKIPEDRSRVYTYVTFEILDIIKGNYEQPTIELRYPGGVIEDMVYTISDMTVPEVSEQGLYFVKSLNKRFVHPLTGWSQGHMLVVKDTNGINRIMSSGRKPITAIEPELPAAKPALPGDNDESAPIVSRGVVTSNPLNMDQALTVDHAKEILENLIKEER